MHQHPFPLEWVGGSRKHEVPWMVFHGWHQFFDNVSSVRQKDIRPVKSLLKFSFAGKLFNLHKLWKRTVLISIFPVFIHKEILACLLNKNLPSVLWRCWLGGRKGIRPVKNWSGGVLAWSSVWSEVQTCIWPNRCHCHSLSLASVKSRLVLPFCYQLTRVVPEKGPLNGCVCVTE